VAFILKGNLLKDYSIDQIKQINHWMNYLPHNILNYQTQQKPSLPTSI